MKLRRTFIITNFSVVVNSFMKIFENPLTKRIFCVIIAIVGVK